ncbi:heparan sulfate 2-O-sulfotransferase 1-like [Neocloeon triangulifer]|uniref:heparan sulfate 2-O-sulfotransferase 1-like n=1 Tax=Neocloeon triangulifer TaxID=2078957 RepID=UPI00286EC893|nr:heparan sulfate 2-O-sulfotransferase 1-like [Neocloeon triangulifer]
MDRKTVRKVKSCLFVATGAIMCLTVVYLNVLSEGRTRVQVKRSLLELDLTEGTVSSRRNVATKSLRELGATPEISQDFLFFNRVPKSGSEMFVLLMTWLQGKNGFRHYRLPGGRAGNDRRLSSLRQEEVVETVNDIRRDSALPTSFDRHMYFTNFTAFGRQNPIYINLIRDPVDKMMSRFYYADLKKRKEAQQFEDCVGSGAPDCNFVAGHLYDLTIPYFCGHESFCSEINNWQALERAKANVEKYFKVVGVLENLNETLAVLETSLPRYFRGVQELYFNELLKPHYNKNKNNPRKMKESTRRKLESSLKMEYDFYNFVKKRLLKQFHSRK